MDWKAVNRKLWRRERINEEVVEVYLVQGLVDEEGDPCHGMWHHDSNTIEIEWEDTSQTKASTLLHERLHCISDKFGLELDERAVRIIERSLMQMERDYEPGEDFNVKTV